MQYQILNTCGTSVLTNPAKGNKELSEILTKYSNTKSEKDIPSEAYEKIHSLWSEQLSEWSAKTEEDVKKSSAELKCLLTWQRNNNVDKSNCMYYLIHTDTVLGSLAAGLIEEWLKKNNYKNVQLTKIELLNTHSLYDFEIGLSNFAKWAFDLKNSDDYSQFIFNIAGGFKSVSGFAQVLGTFIANQTIYIFEGGNEVLQVPHLPIIWGEVDTIRKNVDSYRKVSLGIPLDSYSNLNPLWIQNGKFSPWGQIAWENAKRTIYREEVLSFDCDLVCEGSEFRNSVKDLPQDRIWHINERIDDLIAYAVSGRKNSVSRLDYKKLKGQHPYTHECDAWADGDAKRLFCNEKDGKIIVEKLDKALH